MVRLGVRSVLLCLLPNPRYMMLYTVDYLIIERSPCANVKVPIAYLD